MWVEAGGSSKVIERHARDFEALAKGAGVALERLDGAKAETLWTRITDFRTWMIESYPSALIMRAVLSIGKCEEFLSRAEQEADHDGALLASLSQIGVGVVHLCCLGQTPFSKSLALVKRLREAAEGFGGALVVERCSANIKAALDVWGTPGDDWEVMREVKRAWDPQGILAPGRFVGSL
jgi:glycolate oxidase FAD binding subunit